jgi:hypothetical protein
MLRFCGFALELFVEEVLTRGDWPTVCRARDFTGDQWLIVQINDDPAHLAWLCAQVSDRAIRAITAGHAAPMDAVRHSATGTVELVAVEEGRAVPDRCLLGEWVTDHLPATAGDRVALAA